MSTSTLRYLSACLRIRRRAAGTQRPDALYADRGYDHDKYRKQVREAGIKPVIARRGEQLDSGLACIAGSLSRVSPYCTGSAGSASDGRSATTSTKPSSASPAPSSAGDASTTSQTVGNQPLQGGPAADSANCCERGEDRPQDHRAGGEGLTDAFIAHCHSTTSNCTNPAGWAAGGQTRLSTSGSFDYTAAPNAGGLFLGDYDGLTSSGSTFKALFDMSQPIATAGRSDLFSNRAG